MTKKKLGKVESELAKDDRIAAAFLLGSAARGEMRSDSDVDIAILVEPEATFTVKDRVGLAIALEKIFGREVDLGILDHDNLIYAKEAYSKGRCIYCHDNFYRDLFGATTFGMYADLRESRKEIEDAYRT
jgi:predicted nucleotidyltransferase